MTIMSIFCTGTRIISNVITIYGIVWQFMTIHDNAWQGVLMYVNVCQFMTMHANVWQCMPLYDNAWAMYDNSWHYVTIHDGVCQCMTMYDNVCQCVSNVWQEWMAGYSMQRLRVPGSVAHWSDGDTGVFPLCILLLLFFRILYVGNIWWHWGIPALYSTSALFLVDNICQILFGDSGVFPLCILLLLFFRFLFVGNIWCHLGIPALYSTSALFLLTIFAKYYLVTLGYSHPVFYFGTFCCCKYLVTFRDFSALFSLLLPCVSFQALCCPFSKINLLVTASYSGCNLVVPSDWLIQLTCDSCNFNLYTGSAFKYHQECHAYIRFLCYHRLIYN